jgi:hypothetical protein
VKKRKTKESILRGRVRDLSETPAEGEDRTRQFFPWMTNEDIASLGFWVSSKPIEADLTQPRSRKSARDAR